MPAIASRRQPFPGSRAGTRLGEAFSLDDHIGAEAAVVAGPDPGVVLSATVRPAPWCTGSQTSCPNGCTRWCTSTAGRPPTVRRSARSGPGGCRDSAAVLDRSRDERQQPAGLRRGHAGRVQGARRASSRRAGTGSHAARQPGAAAGAGDADFAHGRRLIGPRRCREALGVARYPRRRPESRCWVSRAGPPRR